MPPFLLRQIRQIKNITEIDELKQEVVKVIHQINHNTRVLKGLFEGQLDDVNIREISGGSSGAIVSIDSVSNPGGDVGLTPTDAIVISPDQANNRVVVGETHSQKLDNPHQVTSTQVGAEPAFTKNTAFNKNFGTVTGTVADGAHVAKLDNPHQVTSTQVGLGNVENVNVEAIRTDSAKNLFCFVGATAPALPTNGMIWYDTSTHIFKGYANGAWVNFH